MQWKQGRRSTNVEDRRGMRIPGGVGGLGLGGLVLVLLLSFLGGGPGALLDMFSGSDPIAAERGVPLAPGDAQSDFVSVVLADTEDVWTEILRQENKRYDPPRLVLFTNAVQSACGFARSATGPFYCPSDRSVFLDLSFFEELRGKLGAPGDFAQAYVIAHEVGHHVQNLLGISDQVQALRSNSSESEGNALSVRLELQADFFAGVWAHHAQSARQILESGDLEEGLNAASKIGDDRLQRETQGRVTPDSFTHGTSKQRVRWFRRGFESGRMSDGDTFSTKDL